MRPSSGPNPNRLSWYISQLDRDGLPPIPWIGNQRLELSHIPVHRKIGFKYFDWSLVTMELVSPLLSILTGGGSLCSFLQHLPDG